MTLCSAGVDARICRIADVASLHGYALARISPRLHIPALQRCHLYGRHACRIRTVRQDGIDVSDCTQISQSRMAKWALRGQRP
jgi:hypothetical protein